MARSIGLAAGLLAFLGLVYFGNGVRWSLAIGIASFILVAGILESFSGESQPHRRRVRQ